MESDRYLIPATAALLEGWTGPVVTTSMAEAGVFTGSAVLRVDPGTRCRVVGWSDDWYPIGDVFLDLRRAEVRDRVARVVAERSCVDPGGGVVWSNTSQITGWPTWRIGGSDSGQAFDPSHVPALASLDPASDERLPDGSRAVDAAALACVAREVLGG